MIVNLGNNKRFKVPQTASDITFQQFVDATAMEQALLKDEEFGYHNLIDILSCYFPDEDLSLVEYDDITPIGSKFLIPGDEFTTVTLYNHVVAVINSYSIDAIKQFSITHKGELFFIAAQEEIFPTRKLTVGESLTMLELSRRVQKLVDKKGDADGNYEFSLGLEEIAILARKKGEMLPIKSKDRTDFIRKRAEVFSDCPLSEILKIRFFFTHFYRKYVKILDTNHSGKGLSFQCRVPKKRERQKRKR
jgi:hypothetical protein